MGFSTLPVMIVTAQTGWECCIVNLDIRDAAGEVMFVIVRVTVDFLPTMIRTGAASLVIWTTSTPLPSSRIGLMTIVAAL